MPHRWTALAVLAVGVMLIGVDATVLTVATPAMTRELGASATEILWIGDIYSLVLASLLVTTGTLGDRIGHRKLLLGSATAFGLASIAAAAAPSTGWLIAARALLGVAGAALAPSTLALIRAIFRDPHERVVAIGIWAAVFSAGSALGPVVGGLLLEHFWWGSVFLVNVPLVACLVIGGTVLLPESREPAPGPWDLASAGLSLVALLGLVSSVKEAAVHGLTVTAVATGGAGAAALLLFVRRQLRLDYPLIDVRLFRNRMFSGVVAANLLSVMGLSGVLFFLSQYFQLVDGYSPMQAGLAELPAAIAAAVSGIVVGFAVRLWSRCAVLAVGLTLIGLALASLTRLTPATGYPALGVALFAVGIGLGVVYTVANDVILASVAPERSGAAAAVSETAFELGMALGIAVLGSIVTVAYRTLAVPNGTETALAEHAMQSLGAAHEAARTLPADQAALLLAEARTAFAHGLALASGIGAVMLLASAAVVWLLPLRTRSAC